MTIVKSLLVWLTLFAGAVANGSLREFVYRHWLEELPAHQLSVLSGIFIFGLIGWLFVRRWPFRSSSQAWRIGILWLGMTIVWEFLFGHYVMGHSWEHLFHDYNLLAGRLWILVLIWVVLLPVTLHRLTEERSRRVT